MDHSTTAEKTEKCRRHFSAIIHINNGIRAAIPKSMTIFSCSMIKCHWGISFLLLFRQIHSVSFFSFLSPLEKSHIDLKNNDRFIQLVRGNAEVT